MADAPQMLTLAREAMNTRFELVLYGDDTIALRAAGEEALDEIERLHHQLSLFSPTSQIAHVNARAAQEPVRVDPLVFELLDHARRLHHETRGAFDITVGPLVRCWGFMGGSGAMPEAGEIAEAQAKTGMSHVRLDKANYTVRFDRPGVMMDLGAIGKGYAIERAAMLLREAGVTSAFLHGGTSTAYGLGKPPESDAWKIAIASPDPDWKQRRSPNLAMLPKEGQSSGKRTLALVSLKDESLSLSAVWGKFFRSGSQAYGHVIDPRTGYPALKAIMGVVVLPSATETDALSTALLTVGAEGHNAIAQLRPGMRTLVVEPSDQHSSFLIECHGIVLTDK